MKGIIFSIDSIRAILDNRKGMTRRVANPQPIQKVALIDNTEYEVLAKSEELVPMTAEEYSKQASPYVDKDGRYRSYYVKEPHYINTEDESLIMFWDGKMYKRITDPDGDKPGFPSAKAAVIRLQKSLNGVEMEYLGKNSTTTPEWFVRRSNGIWKKRSPIYMPIWATRMIIHVNEVSIEKLQEISDNDCIKEGIKVRASVSGDYDKYENYTDPRFPCLTPKRSFSTLWNSVNGKKQGLRWEDNPWVWVIGFTHRKTNILNNGKG